MVIKDQTIWDHSLQCQCIICYSCISITVLKIAFFEVTTELHRNIILEWFSDGRTEQTLWTKEKTLITFGTSIPAPGSISPMQNLWHRHQWFVHSLQISSIRVRKMLVFNGLPNKIIIYCIIIKQGMPVTHVWHFHFAKHLIWFCVMWLDCQIRDHCEHTWI